MCLVRALSARRPASQDRSSSPKAASRNAASVTGAAASAVLERKRCTGRMAKSSTKSTNAQISGAILGHTAYARGRRQSRLDTTMGPSVVRTGVSYGTSWPARGYDVMNILHAKSLICHPHGKKLNFLFPPHPPKTMLAREALKPGRSEKRILQATPFSTLYIGERVSAM